jgi:hypothetical protein
MSDKFKKLANHRQPVELRAAIPQVDPEATKPDEPVAPSQPAPEQSPVESDDPKRTATASKTVPATERPIFLTPVDTSEQPTNRGFFMYPSRHTQVARDLAYIEGRNPWKIIEDALEEYVVKHYGKEYQRK